LIASGAIQSVGDPARDEVVHWLVARVGLADPVRQAIDVGAVDSARIRAGADPLGAVRVQVWQGPRRRSLRDLRGRAFVEPGVRCWSLRCTAEHRGAPGPRSITLYIVDLNRFTGPTTLTASTVSGSLGSVDPIFGTPRGGSLAFAFNA